VAAHHVRVEKGKRGGHAVSFPRRDASGSCPRRSGGRRREIPRPPAP
jgi:hypothetical protein